MANDERLPEESKGIKTFLWPVLALVVVVGVISALVLTGVLKGDRVDQGSGVAPTTLPTIQVAP